MAESEFVQLQRRIELECEAMKRAMTGFAIVARHRFISHRYTQIGVYRKQLEQLVGKEQAGEVVGTIYLQVMENEREVEGKPLQKDSIPDE